MPAWPNSSFPPLLPQQRLAVDDEHKGIIVKGDSGTGRTYVLGVRALRQLQEGMLPDDMLYLTWSERGVQVLRKTFEQWVDDGRREASDSPREGYRQEAHMVARLSQRALDSQFTTVNQFCLQYLRSVGARQLGLDPNFSVLTHEQQMQLVARMAAQNTATRALSSAELLEFLQWYRRHRTLTSAVDPQTNPHSEFRRMILEEIAYAGHEGWATPHPPPDVSWLDLERLYMEEKRRQGLLDLDELVQTAANARRIESANKPDHVVFGASLFVDEVEEMTALAIEVILNELSFFDSITMAYNPTLRTGIWSGADAGSVMSFLEKHGDLVQHVLRINPRSSPTVSSFLAQLADSPALEGLDVRNSEGIRRASEVPQLREYEDWTALTQAIVEFAQQAQSDRDLQRVACLVRWPATMDLIRASLDEAGIPVSILGTSRAKMTPAYGLLALLFNRHDLEALSAAAVTWSSEGWTTLNPFSAAVLSEASRRQGCDLIDAAHQHIRTLTRHSGVRGALQRVVDGLTALHAMPDNGVDRPVLLDLYFQAYKSLSQEDRPRPVPGDDDWVMMEYALAFPQYQGESTSQVLRRFLDSITLNGIPEKSQPGLTLSSIRDARGLQWPEVLVVGAGQQILPGQLDSQTPPLPLWEEQRLLYVAASRARDRLVFYNLKDSDLKGIWEQLTR